MDWRSTLGLSERVRGYLEIVAGRLPDGDGAATEPLVGTLALLSIGQDDAEALCLCVDLADAIDRWNQTFGTAATDRFVRALMFLVRVVEDYEVRYGRDAAERMLRNLVQLMGQTATTETVQFVTETTEGKS